MASYFVTSIVEGQWFYVTDATPVATISAPRGSLAIRTDAGNESLWINTTAGASPGTNWARILSPNINGDIDLTSVDQLTLADNANPALDIGSTGLLNLLRFITTNGAEQVAYRGALPFNIVTGGLLVSAGTVAFPAASVNLGLSASASADLTVSSAFTLRMVVGAGQTALATLPNRTGGWRVIDCWVVSAGLAGGTITVRNVTAAADVSNAMGVGAAGVITRTTQAANSVFAGGGQISAVGAANPDSTVYVNLIPL